MSTLSHSSQLVERISAIMKFDTDADEDLFAKVKSLIIDLIVRLQVESRQDFYNAEMIKVVVE